MKPKEWESEYRDKIRAEADREQGVSPCPAYCQRCGGAECYDANCWGEFKQQLIAHAVEVFEAARKAEGDCDEETVPDEELKRMCGELEWMPPMSTPHDPEHECPPSGCPEELIVENEETRRKRIFEDTRIELVHTPAWSMDFSR